MGNAITSLKEHHIELLGLSKQLVSALDAQDLDSCVDDIRLLFTKLLGHLEFHLLSEDEHLYPVLLQHPDERVRWTAERFMEQLGGLANAVEMYKANWRGREQILAEPESFGHDMRVLVAALAKRINKEENELFPLVAA